MNSEEKNGTMMEKIDSVVEDMPKADGGYMTQTGSNAGINEYISDNAASEKVELLRIFYREENGEPVFYIEECALYSLGDREIASNPFSVALIPIYNFEWLEKLIRFYEMRNPGIKVEKKYVEYSLYMDTNNSPECWLVDYYDKLLKERINTNEEVSEEEFLSLMNELISNIDYDKVKNDILKRHSGELYSKENDFKL